MCSLSELNGSTCSGQFSLEYKGLLEAGQRSPYGDMSLTTTKPWSGGQGHWASCFPSTSLQIPKGTKRATSLPLRTKILISDWIV